MRYLKKGTYKYRIGVGAPVYMAAVIEYLAGKQRTSCCKCWSHPEARDIRGMGYKLFSPSENQALQVRDLLKFA